MTYYKLIQRREGIRTTNKTVVPTCFRGEISVNKTSLKN